MKASPKTKSLISSLAAVAVLGTGVVGASGQAYAAPGKAVGRCVKTTAYYQPSFVDVAVKNNCKSTVKAKVIMKYGKDSGCMTIKKGKTRWHHGKNLATYSKTVKC
ncbi:hypothetical protein [Streptomyces sp. NPDC056987]|uniref:hypothetical protein n=1 Tax=Streptomyces sp. NPDC056987 TaxID=3345988 RepID=UPI00362C6965